jgi:predicted RNA-binding protein with PIN domain
MPQKLKYLIVDGHSVIHAWPDLLRLHRAVSKRHLARLGLLKRLRLLQDMSGERVVVVFDGTGSRTSEERENEGLQIFYADAKATADTVVERLAIKYAALHPLTVVSADGMVRNSALASGAEWMSPEGLGDRCSMAEKQCTDELARLRRRQ